MKLIPVLLLVSFCFLFVAADYDAAYYLGSNGDGDFKDYKNWMSRLSDNTLLSELALPGTHDSSTFTSYLNGFVKTQSRTFSQQFKDGIRFFDIRIRHTGNKFALHHGSVFLDNFFGDFLNQLFFFLRDNPTETVFFRLKEDHDPDDNNNRRLQETLVEYLYEKDIHSKYVNTNDLKKPIKLKDVRGKFIIVSNMLEFHFYGIPYGGWSFDIQDDHDSFAVYELNDKFVKVREQIDKARSGSKDTFYVNYLSA